jgi:hypothetical protein
VRDGQPSPHRPRLVVSRSTCPPISPPPPCKQLCTRSCSNKHTHLEFCPSVLVAGLGNPFLEMAEQDGERLWTVQGAHRRRHCQRRQSIAHTYLRFRQPSGHEHPFINCSTSLNNALNIWLVPPGPDWWQHRMCLDIAHPDWANGATPEISIRWMIYHAAVQGAPHGPSITFVSTAV